MSTLYEELRDLIAALNREGIEYALCGGIAMAIHGRPRSTVDIDMLILAESLSDTLRIAADLGYTVRGLDLHFPRDVIEIRRVSKSDQTRKAVLTLDMILVTEPIRGIWDTRINAKLGEDNLSVVSKEGLITLKEMSGRPQDLADISALTEDSDATS